MLYCFLGFFLAGDAESVWMEQELFRAFWSFSLTVSTVPALLFLLNTVWQIYSSSDLLIHAGRELYFRRSIKWVLGMNAGFIAYYGTGVYHLSALYFSEGSWQNQKESLIVWLSEMLLLFLFFCIISILFLFLRTKNVQPAGAMAVVLILTYLFWKKIEVYGMLISDLFFSALSLLFVVIIWRWHVRESSFINWR